jgi:hypothetical protein
MVETSKIYEYRFHNPQKNFLAGNNSQNPEAQFAEQFAQAYYNKFLQIHSGTSKRKTLFVRCIIGSGGGAVESLLFKKHHCIIQICLGNL